MHPDTLVVIYQRVYNAQKKNNGKKDGFFSKLTGVEDGYRSYTCTHTKTNSLGQCNYSAFDKLLNKFLQ